MNGLHYIQYFYIIPDKPCHHQPKFHCHLIRCLSAPTRASIGSASSSITLLDLWTCFCKPLRSSVRVFRGFKDLQIETLARISSGKNKTCIVSWILFFSLTEISISRGHWLLQTSRLKVKAETLVLHMCCKSVRISSESTIELLGSVSNTV